MAFLTIRIKGVEGYRRHPLDKERLVVGRLSSSGIHIDHASVSREHCAIIKVVNLDSNDEVWVVEDLGSSNGTRLGEAQVLARTQLKEKDIIKCGRARMTFHAGEIPVRHHSEPEILIYRAKPGDPLESVPCTKCHAWFSIAHRETGDPISCPHCGADQVVPDLIAATTTVPVSSSHE